MERTSEEKVLGGLTHVAAIFGWVGVVAGIVLVLIYREKSKYVFAHAKQGLALSVLNVVVGYLLGFLGAGSVGLLSIGSLGSALGSAMLLGLIAMVWGILVLIFAIMAAIKGFKGEEYQYPFFGKMVSGMGE